MKKTAQHLLETIARAASFLLKINDLDASQRPAPGKWSKKEIIGHLLDSACNNQQKFVRTMLAPDGHLDFVGYAQDDWVAVQRYQDCDWRELVAFWVAYNRQLAHLIAHCPPEALGNTISIAGNGPFRLDFIMPDYIEHLKHHLKAAVPEAGFESSFANVYDA